MCLWFKQKKYLFKIKLFFSKIILKFFLSKLIVWIRIQIGPKSWIRIQIFVFGSTALNLIITKGSLLLFCQFCIHLPNEPEHFLGCFPYRIRIRICPCGSGSGSRRDFFPWICADPDPKHC